MSATEAPAPRRAVVVLLAAVLFAATLGVYWKTGEFGFLNYDDNTYVTHNPAVADGLTGEGARWAFTTFYAANWHPLTWLSHMADVSLFGPDAAGHHRTNALLHALTAALVFVALCAYTRALGASLFVAAFFALHPLRVESVAWISERKDLLAGLFGVAALIAYERYARSAGGRRVRMALVAVLLALGLLAKPMLVTLPFVLLLLDAWPLGRRNVAALVREKLPLFALVLASCVITSIAQRAGGALEALHRVTFVPRVVQAFEAIGSYVSAILWPTNLAVFYPHRAALDAADYSPWSVAAGLGFAIAVGVTAIGWWKRARMPWILVGWLWFCGMLVPVLGFVQVGMQSHADRYTYLPSIGVALALAFSVRALCAGSKARTHAAGVLATCWIAALVPLTRAQLETWRSTTALMEHAIAVTDRNFVAHLNLASAYERERRLTDAVTHYKEAVRIRPGKGISHYQLARLLQDLRRNEEAVEQFQLAVDAERAERVPGPVLPVAYAGLGVAQSLLGRDAEAIPNLRAAWRTIERENPDRASAGQALAWLLATTADDALRNGAEAREVAGECLAMQPGPALLEVMAAAHAELGEWERAIAFERQALGVLPEGARGPARERLALYERHQPYRKP